MDEHQAYNQYVEECHSELGVYCSEYSFKEWQIANRPKGPYKECGNYTFDNILGRIEEGV